MSTLRLAAASLLLVAFLKGVISSLERGRRCACVWLHVDLMADAVHPLDLSQPLSICCQHLLLASSETKKAMAQS